MASRRRERDARPARDQAEAPPARSSIYLSEANPPPKSVSQLIIAASLFAIWFAFLLWMVLTT